MNISQGLFCECGLVDCTPYCFSHMQQINKALPVISRFDFFKLEQEFQSNCEAI